MAWPGYRDVPGLRRRGTTDEQRIAFYRVFWEKIYRDTPWEDLTREDKKAIIKCRMPRPPACPLCGKGFPYLWNKGGMADDNNDWYYACRTCAANARRGPRKHKGPGCASSQFEKGHPAWNKGTHKK